MNMERINDYIDCWAKAVKVSKEDVEVVKELIPKLIIKYTPVFKEITVEEDGYDKYPIKPKNGSYSLEDFFLNRLLRNVWNFGQTSSYKGDYTPDDLCVSFNQEQLRIQLAKFISKDRDDFKELDEIARKKVKMHEFEHALQTRFNISSLDLRYRETYKNIIENIKQIKKGEYANEVYDYEFLRDKDYFGARETYISTGLHYSGTVKEIKTYREVEGFDNLNEIFNESESLEMAGARRQTYRVYDKKHYYEIRNMESSNFPITNYGNLIKLLLGDKTTFKGMYLDASNAFKTFNDRYADIFKEYFNNDKDAVENLIIMLDKIKKDDELKDHLFIQEVLSKCMLKKVQHNLGKTSPEILKEELKQFKSYCVWGVDKESRNELNHYHIILKARDLINEQIEKEKNNKKV